MEIGEGVGDAIDSPENEEECSTCAKSKFEGYKTKHGKLKKSTKEKQDKKNDKQ